MSTLAALEPGESGYTEYRHGTAVHLPPDPRAVEPQARAVSPASSAPVISGTVTISVHAESVIRRLRRLLAGLDPLAEQLAALTQAEIEAHLRALGALEPHENFQPLAHDPGPARIHLAQGGQPSVGK